MIIFEIYDKRCATIMKKKKDYYDCLHDSGYSHGGYVVISTYRKGPKCAKNSNFKKIEKKVFGSGVGGQGR